MRILAFSVVVAVLTTSVVAAVQQEEDDVSRDPRLTRQEVVYVEDRADVIAEEASVTARIPIDRIELPTSVSVIAPQQLREQGARVMGDALVNVPGVTVQPSSGVHEIFVIRGFDSLNTGLVLMSGAPEPEATFYQLYNIDRIEVQRGPSSSVYGATPMSGVVDLVRKRPLRVQGLDVALTGGSFDTWRATVDYNQGSGERPLAFRFNGLYGSSDGYRDGIESETWAVNPTVGWWLEGGSTLRLDLELMSNDYTPDAGVPVRGSEDFDVPRRRSYASPFDDSDQDVLRARLDWNGFTLGDWELRDLFYWTELDWVSDGTVFNGVFPLPVVGETLFRTLASLDNEQRVIGNQFEAVRRDERNDLLLGFELRRTEDEFTIDVAQLPPIPVFLPVETATQRPPAIPGFGQAGDARSTLISPYVVDRLQVGERFRILAGARLDILDYEDRLVGIERNEEEISPMLGLTWLPDESLGVYGHYSEAFSAPSSRVQEEREPEEANQVEVGVKANLLEGRLLANFAAYRLEVENLAIFDDTGFTAQLGSQRSKGLELELIGTPGRGWRYTVAYGYTDAELTEFNERILISQFPPEFVVVDRSGNDPAFAPEHVLNAWLVRYYDSGWGWGVGGRYVSEQFIAEDNLFEIDDYTTLDAMISYGLEHWRFTLNGRNLTGEEYFQRGFASTSVIPASDTEVSLTVEWRQ